jgi:hypothetical protein
MGVIFLCKFNGKIFFYTKVGGPQRSSANRKSSNFADKFVRFADLFNTASTVSEDAGIETRTVATLALTASRSNHSARSSANVALCGFVI